MRYALITSGLVINVIEWDGETEWTTPEDCTLVQSDTAGPGWTYEEGVFTPPSPPEDEPAPEE